MNDTPSSPATPANASREETMSALFASMVIQQTNMALMLLGKMPHPETGQTIREIDSARMFIDQLEMLAIKTQGNLDPREEKLLKQSLTSLRMAFVEAVNQPSSQPETAPAGGASKAATAAPAGGTEPTTTDDDSRKKFSKKY